MINRKLMIAACLILGALTTAGCKQKVESPPPELRILSDAEADKMFDAAEKVEAVGEAKVSTEVAGNITVTTTTQVFRLNNGGGKGPTLALGSCTGQCMTTDGDFPNCKSSGCAPAGKGCTTLVCSGSCSLSQQCKRSLTVGASAGGGIL